MKPTLPVNYGGRASGKRATILRQLRKAIADGKRVVLIEGTAARLIASMESLRSAKRSTDNSPPPPRRTSMDTRKALERTKEGRVYSDREIIELFRMLLRTQIREERINSIEELHGLLRHVDAALSAPQPDLVGEIVAFGRSRLEKMRAMNSPPSPLFTGGIHSLADFIGDISRRFGSGNGGWLPIESAPNDHSAVLVWSINQGRSVAFRDVTWEWWSIPNGDGPMLHQPTHWHPLPPGATP